MGSSVLAIKPTNMRESERDHSIANTSFPTFGHMIYGESSVLVGLCESEDHNDPMFWYTKQMTFLQDGKYISPENSVDNHQCHKHHEATCKVV